MAATSGFRRGSGRVLPRGSPRGTSRGSALGPPPGFSRGSGRGRDFSDGVDGPQFCFLFVDDSNLWIESKKVGARRLRDEVEEDKRIRIDLGKLTSVLLRGRRLDAAFLYGSEPPPNDSVWRAAEERNFQISIKKRGNGKEKEVDTALATDVTEQSTIIRYSEKMAHKRNGAVFILVTGDRDLLPTVEKVLDHGFRCEVWAYSHSLATAYRQIVDERFAANHLDDIFPDITFVQVMSTRRASEIHPARALVLRGVPVSAKEDVLAALNALCRVYYLTFLPCPDGSLDIVVEAPRVTADCLHREILEHFAHFYPSFHADIVGYPTYKQRAAPAASLPVSNRYAELNRPPTPHDIQQLLSADPGSVCPASSVSDVDVSDENVDDDDEGGAWITVLRKEDPAVTAGRRRRACYQCTYGIHCRLASKCENGHTAEEKELFKAYSGLDFLLWKSRLCEKTSAHNPKTCSFAHTAKESWCLGCRVWGHLQSDCPYISPVGSQK